MIIGPGFVFGLVFALQQTVSKSIYKRLILVLASIFIYYVATVIAIYNFDYLVFLTITNGAKEQLRFFTAGLFGAAMLGILRLTLGKYSINILKSFLTVLGGGLIGLVFYFLSDNVLGFILSFILWQTVVGVGLYKSFEYIEKVAGP